MCRLLAVFWDQKEVFAHKNGYHMEYLGKVVNKIIDTRLRENLRLHDALNRLHRGRGTGTAILELNMAQDLDSTYQDTPFLVSLDLRKSSIYIQGHQYSSMVYSILGLSQVKRYQERGVLVRSI